MAISAFNDIDLIIDGNKHITFDFEDIQKVIEKIQYYVESHFAFGNKKGSFDRFKNYEIGSSYYHYISGERCYRSQSIYCVLLGTWKEKLVNFFDEIKNANNLEDLQFTIQFNSKITWLSLIKKIF